MIPSLLMLIAWAVFPAQAHRLHTVEITNFSYQPAELRVHAGDTLHFVNNDIVAHTATAKDSSWDSGAIASKQMKKVVLRQKGSASYICAYHPNMAARIIVE
jgi:plastocyanin